MKWIDEHEYPGFTKIKLPRDEEDKAMSARTRHGVLGMMQLGLWVLILAAFVLTPDWKWGLVWVVLSAFYGVVCHAEGVMDGRAEATRNFFHANWRR